MDVLFSFVGDKFAVVVTDTVAVQQIIVQKDDMEKTMDLDSHKLLALSGPKAGMGAWDTAGHSWQSSSLVPRSAPVHTRIHIRIGDGARHSSCRRRPSHARACDR
jgi:hypothetical protein